MRKKAIAFGWYGGKYSHLDFIVPNLPTDAEHFCDVYGGSAAVLINCEPYPVETYNDLDSEVTNFFETLRNQEGKLVKQLALTPFSREELVRACEPTKGLTKLERARRFYVRARQTRTGLAQKSSEGRWAHCVLTSRAGMAGAVSRWLGSVEGLGEIVQRLQRVQIENAPAVEIIQRYDTPKTLFYLDPPYVHETRSDPKAYRYEMDEGDHRELAKLVEVKQGRLKIVEVDQSVAKAMDHPEAGKEGDSDLVFMAENVKEEAKSDWKERQKRHFAGGLSIHQVTPKDVMRVIFAVLPEEARRRLAERVGEHLDTYAENQHRKEWARILSRAETGCK